MSRCSTIWVESAVEGEGTGPHRGALRGGSHVHVFSPDGSAVSFTYEDEVLARLGPGSGEHQLNQRNLGVAVPGAAGGVRVAHTPRRNHDGEWFSVLVTRTVNQPRPGSDEISRQVTRRFLSWPPHGRGADPESSTEACSAGARDSVSRFKVNVWLCSGQSNMALMVRAAADAEREMAAANFPLIRQFKVPTGVAEGPGQEVGGSWTTCSPETVGSFSAVAYFFARDLHQKLNVPVGLVHSSWGGTQIEGWMNDATLRADPAAREIQARWEKTLADYPAAVAALAPALAKWSADEAAAKAAGKAFARPKPRAPEGPGSRWLPAGIYNAMIAPLVPYTLRGAIWYQGETNAARHDEYASLFTAMIKQWRADFAQPLPFYCLDQPDDQRLGGQR